MLKFIKFIIGILLLPLCVVAAQVCWGLLETAARPASAALLPAPALALVSGFMLWLAVFSLFPRPVRSYILAHELTHALWGLLMGASISKISVKEDRGAVILSKTNFLITLAPYFFPLYTVLAIGLYYLLGRCCDVTRYYLLWLGLVGATWGFHLTFTVSALLQRQTDIRDQGRLFSYTVIFLANVIGICAWVISVSSATVAAAAKLSSEYGIGVWGWITDSANRLWPYLHSLFQ
jgi:hypothetical protein